MNKKALVAMSGGVDSSVTALMMKNAGYECIGATMHLFDNEDAGLEREKTCCSLSDVEDAASVARRMGIKHYVFNFKDEFRDKVINNFICEYECGGTPNPCIDCNKYMKFDKLLSRAKVLGCDKIATGHYVRINYNEETGRYELLKAVDETKDQSYVLYSMTQEQLSHTVFPLGELRKTEVRKIAEENGFVNARKKDSQDICFVPDGDYASFIERYSGKKFPCGDFCDKNGNVLARHSGIIKYTIGQRKGLGVAFGKPMYVCDKCIENNTVILGENDDLFKDEVLAKDFNWVSITSAKEPVKVQAKIRYNQSAQNATLYQIGENDVRVVFDKPQRAPAKGQALVCYDGDKVLGGGTII